MWVEDGRATGEGFASLDHDAALKRFERFEGRDALDLHPVFAVVAADGVKEALIECGFIAEQEQAFGVGIQAAEGVNAFREAEVGQGAVRRAVGSELGQNAIGLVKGDEHTG